jgi:hypothetical protein
MYAVRLKASLIYEQKNAFYEKCNFRPLKNIILEYLK